MMSRYKNSLAVRDTEVRCKICHHGPKVVYISSKRGSKLRRYRATCSHEICRSRLIKNEDAYYSKEEALVAWEIRQNE